jgi:hypothetical protein
VLYVLDCPEFAPLLAAGRGRPGVSVTRTGTHFALRAEAGDLVISRTDTDLIDAVWFGALTGGIVGNVARFDADEIRLTGRSRPEADD